MATSVGEGLRDETSLVESIVGLKVLHVTQPVTDGVAKVALKVATAQASHGARVSFACPSGPLGSAATSSGLQHEVWEARRNPGPSVVSEVMKLTEIVDRVAPDVVHLHSAKAGLVGRLSIRGRIPTIYQPHAWSFEAVTGLTSKSAKAWEKLGTAWTDFTICCSREELEMGRVNHINSPMGVIPNSVDPAHFAPLPAPARNQVRRRLGLSESTPLAILVGRLSRQKGQDIAIKAWGEVTKVLPGACLLLVGDGPEKSALASMTSGADNVRFLGIRDDVNELLAASDVCLLPSRWEGMPLTLLEAMSCGCPVVAANVAGVKSALIDGIEPPAGVLISSEDPDALAAAILDLLGSTASAAGYGDAGRLRASSHHGLDSQLIQITQTYGRAIQRRQTRHGRGPRLIRLP